MLFTLVWEPAAEDKLALLWIGAQNQQAVADSSDRIEDELRRDPETKGFPFLGEWIRIDLPLAVSYRINFEDRIVQVLDVWLATLTE